MPMPRRIKGRYKAMTSTTGQIATALIAAHKTGKRINVPEHDLSRPDILDIQQRVAAALGPVAGFKVSRAENGPPILAPLPACYTVANGGQRQVPERLGLELEIGFKVIRALPEGALPARPQDYLRPYAIFELVDSRFDTKDLPADAKFCDFQMNAGLVVGTGLQNWDGADFCTVMTKLDTSDTILEDVVSIPGGSALANLDLLVRHISTHCGGIKVGQILITGALTGLSYFAAKRLIQGEIAGIGYVSVTFEPAGLPT